MLYNYLIINNYIFIPVTQLVLLSTIESTILDSQPDHIKKHDAPDFRQAFFCAGNGRPELAQGLTVTAQKRQA